MNFCLWKYGQETRPGREFISGNNDLDEALGKKWSSFLMENNKWD